jgi:hypothetical protein
VEHDREALARFADEVANGTRTSDFQLLEQQEVEVAPVEEHVALRGHAAYRG